MTNQDFARLLDDQHEAATIAAMHVQTVPLGIPSPAVTEVQRLKAVVAALVEERDKWKRQAKELGDVLWYVAALCTKADLDMGEVMQGNIDKLRRRYPDGFSSEDSKRRVDVEAVQP